VTELVFSRPKGILSPPTALHTLPGMRALLDTEMGLLRDLSRPGRTRGSRAEGVGSFSRDEVIDSLNI